MAMPAAPWLQSQDRERATYDSVAFRFIAPNRHPDHDTLPHFRKTFLMELEDLIRKAGKRSLEQSEFPAHTQVHCSPESKDLSAGKPLALRPAAPTAGSSIVCCCAVLVALWNFTLFSFPTCPLGIVNEG